MKRLPITNSINRPPWRLGFLLIPLALTCFALTPAAQAVIPAPDGGYPGGNTAEGEDALFDLTTGLDNTALGNHALWNNTTGNDNTATGSSALLNNTTGNDNTATGSGALFDNIGSFNTATGRRALTFNTTGFSNTATGSQALANNTTGNNNTANGDSALYSNTIGQYNTANGFQALYSNNGDSNTANGFRALIGNTTGSANTANGSDALLSNTTGFYNTATGHIALRDNTTGFNNTATGMQALPSNTTGSYNTANGVNVLLINTTGFNNTAIGADALRNNTTGGSNIALGFQAGQNLTTGSFNIDIGSTGVAGDSRKIRIGVQGTQNGTFIAGISGATVPGGVGVIVGTNGKLGTVVSSARFKDAIKPMDKASEAILALRPVTFRYNKEIDPEGIPQFGLVAEEVEKVDPALVARDADGKVYTVRYEAVNAMLLNEFLKEHHQLQDLKAIVAEQQKQIKALTSGLQKVSDKVELDKPAPQTVSND